MKKLLKIVIVLLLILVNFNNAITVYADTQSDLEKATNEQLESLDLDDLQKILDTYQNGEIILSDDIKSLLSDIINGNYIEYFNSNKIISIVLNEFKGIKEYIPIFITMICIGIIISILKEFNLTKREDISSIINVVFIGFIIVIILMQISNFINITKDTLGNIKKQMDAIFPVLLTIMTALGSSKSVSFFQPIITLICNVVIDFMINLGLPLLILSLVLVICLSLSKNIKLTKLNNFLQNSFRWGIGLIFTIFMAVIAIQGIVVSNFDSISIRTVKYTIKSFIPFGNFFADSLNIIMASSVLIKNAIGFSGLIILFFSILEPIISILCFKFLLDFSSGLLEPICNKNLCELFTNISKILTMLIITIVVCSIMYLILIATIMSVANNFI